MGGGSALPSVGLSFVGIKVVQYQGSVGIFAEPLVSIQIRGRGSIL